MAKLFCIQCHTVAKPGTKVSGSIIIEIFLWCMFFIPGFIYSVWRGTTRKKCCRCCKSINTLIPVGSPAADTFLRDAEIEIKGLYD